MSRPVVLLLAALAAACGGAASTTSTTIWVSTTTTDGGTTTSHLPGSGAESAFASGDVVGVIAADHEVTHRLLSVPGDSGEIVGELQPTATGLRAVGIARELDGVLWERIRDDGSEGFFPRRMLAFIGEAEDVTDLFTGVTAESIEDLAFEVAAEIEATSVVTVAEPGPLEVVSDVIGLGDDAIAGYRVKLTAIEAGGVFEPSVVERTPLCWRGIGDDGSCI